MEKDSLGAPSLASGSLLVAPRLWAPGKGGTGGESREVRRDISISAPASSLTAQRCCWQVARIPARAKPAASGVQMH